MISRLVVSDLIEWKEDSLRKPLILRGARQVGKTTVVQEFAKEFDVFLKLNLELEADNNLFETFKEINKLIEAIHLHCKKKVGSGTCLLFIDELSCLLSNGLFTSLDVI